jgi:hypothetical protein
MEILENVLSIEKMKHLQELGVNTGNASMTWMLYPYEEGKQPQLSLREWKTFKEPFRKEHCIPAFTFLDILELLPKEIKTGTDTYWITMYFSDNCSLQEQCRTDRSLCTVIAGYYNSDERFINRGEVTDIKIDKEE